MSSRRGSVGAAVTDLATAEVLPTLADFFDAPSGWREHSTLGLPIPKGARVFDAGRLRVIVSLDDCGAEGVWLHTSVSVLGRVFARVPSWEDLARVKQIVHGDRYAIQILPPRAQYVNVAEVLHLWERIDAPTIPDAIGRASR